MSEVNSLEDVYDLALEHAEAGRGPRDEYLDTFDSDFTDDAIIMVEGMSIEFHIDNEPAIYYTIGHGADDLVYVDNTQGTGPVVSKQEFVNRVKEIAAEEAERYN